MAEATGINDMRSGANTSDIERNELAIVTSSENISDGGNNNVHIVNIDKWVSFLTRILEDVPQYMCTPGHPGRVTRIPENLLEVDIKAYESYFVSIGPYHHGKTRLEQMEKRKRFVLKCVLENKPQITLKDYLRETKSLESAARSFYSDVEMNSEEFVRMFLVDSMYIITVFCDLSECRETVNQANMDETTQINEEFSIGEDSENINGIGEQSGDTSELPRWFWILFMHDIFLLENQIPFFVLQKLYAFANGGNETQLVDIMKYKVGSMLLSYTKLDSEMVILPNAEVHHILHLCHMFFRPTVQHPASRIQFNVSAWECSATLRGQTRFSTSLFARYYIW